MLYYKIYINKHKLFIINLQKYILKYIAPKFKQ